MGNAALFRKKTPAKPQTATAPLVVKNIHGKSTSFVSKTGDGKKGKHVTFASDEKVLIPNEFPGNCLVWSQEEKEKFKSCFKAIFINAGSEISSSDQNLFFMVSEGEVEVHAIIPTLRKKTSNIREFLCKKGVGDMVYLPSIKNLIAESTTKDFLEKEGRENVKHKNVLDVIDTIEIKSVEDSTILQLDWDKFDMFFPDDGADAKGDKSDSVVEVDILRSIMKANLSDYLVMLPILKGISQSKLELLARLCTYSVIDQGSVVCTEGSIGDEMYIVLQGELKVEASARGKNIQEEFAALMLGADSASDAGAEINVETRKAEKRASTIKDYFTKSKRFLFQAQNKCLMKDADENLQSVQLALIGSGMYFGEMSIFTDLPRSATVTATRKCLLARISKEDFNKFHRAISQGLETNIEEIVKRYMLENLFQLMSPFLEQIEMEDVDRMAGKTSITHVKKDAVIFKEGDEASSFYFLYDGSVRVDRTKEGNVQTVGYLSPGDYFGEISVLNHGKRLATITATSDIVLLEISKESFFECFEHTPSLLAEFVVRMKGMRVDLDSILRYTKSRDCFLRFLEAQCLPLHVSFLEKSEEFERQFDDMSQVEADRKSKDIVLDFFTCRRIGKLTPPKVLADRIEYFPAIGSASKDMFEEARASIRSQLTDDILPKFKETTEFAALMKILRIYEYVET